MNNTNLFNKPARLRKVRPLSAALLRWGVVIVILYYSLKIDEPMISRYRSAALIVLPIVSILLALRCFRVMKRNRGRFGVQFERGGAIAMLCFALFMLGYEAVVFEYKKRVVLSSSETVLNRLGRHFIVGYRNAEEIHRLLDKRAIAGVYVTARNIRNKSMGAMQAELKTFQSMALERGAPPLFLAADQEGGKVSRLSPLLRRMPTLAQVIAANTDHQKISDAVRNYAITQARQLAGLGINLNLSPVVDLKTDGIRHMLNIHSRIDQRAISADADIVSDVAGVYCAALLGQGVRPTLKHFPGLGSVSEDTHFNPGTLDRSKELLEKTDWRPFREAIARTDPFIMLGHVRVPGIDPDLPASLSSKIIKEILRSEWQFEGILITDDFNMGAITQRKEGIGKSAVRSLNAGADLILLSFDGSQYYKVMYAMIKADEQGTLDQAALQKSRQRLQTWRPLEPTN